MYASRQRKALRRYQQEIARGAAKYAEQNSYGYFGVTPPKAIRWAPDRRLMAPLVSIVGSGSRYYATESASSGDYQDAIYGPPSIFWEPNKSSNGDGTEGNPYQYTQLAANVEAGDVVGILPGFQALTTTDDDDIPAFDPGVSGTALSRVVYVGKYDPATLGDPLTSGDRSQVGHTGTDPGTGVNRNCCPTIGHNARNYVTFDSIVLNHEDGPFQHDAGAMAVNESTGARYYRIWVQGAADDPANVELSNYCALWNDGSTDLHVADCTFKGIRFLGNDFQGYNTTSNISVFVLYSAHNVLIENCDVEDCNQVVYSKGNDGSGGNYGLIRRLRVLNCGAVARIQECHASNVTEFSQILATGIERYGYALRQTGAGTCRNVTIRNTTTVCDESGAQIFTTGDSSLTSTSAIQIFENIGRLPAGGSEYHAFGATTLALTRCRDNSYSRASGTHSWSYNGSNYSAIGDYQSALQAAGLSANAREENSISTDPQLNATTFRPEAAGPLSMGTSSGLGGAGGEIGYGGGNPTIGRR